MAGNKECTKCGSVHEGPTGRRCLVEMADSGALASQQQSMQASTSATSTSSDVALVTARNMAVDSRVTPTEASSKAPVSPASPLPTSKTNNSADSIILQTLQGIRAFEQDAQSDRRLLASVVEKLESHDEVLVKFAADGKRRHKSSGGAKGGKSAKNNISNMNSDEVQINNSQQNLLSTNNSIFPQCLNNLQVAGQNVAENAVPSLSAAISTAPNAASPLLCSTSTSACIDPHPVSSSVVGYQMTATHGVAAGQARGVIQQAPEYVSNCKCTGSKTVPISATGPRLGGKTEADNQADQPIWQHGAGGAQQHTGGHNPGSTSQIEGVKQDHILPTMQALQQTAAIQQQVHRRFQELETAKNNDQGNLESFIEALHKKVNIPSKSKIKWPQDHAFVGTQRKKLTYEQLDQGTWLLGFLRIRQGEEDPIIRENMIDYLTELIQDSCDFSWEGTKGAHYVLLQRMMDNRLDWTQLDQVHKVRERYAHSASAISSGNNSSERSKNLKTVACFKYNKHNCNKPGDHEFQNLLLRHICHFCFSRFNRVENHTKKECPKAAEEFSKN